MELEDHIVSSRAPVSYVEAKRDVHTIPVGLENAWPMSLLVQAMTSSDDDEIMESLKLVRDASRLGLVHESVDVDRMYEYTSKSP